MNPLILRLKNSIDKSVLDSIDKNLLGLHLFVPISVKDNFLFVAVCKSSDKDTISRILKKTFSHSIKFVLVGDDDLKSLLSDILPKNTEIKVPDSEQISDSFATGRNSGEGQGHAKEGRLGEILLQKGLVSDVDLMKALGESKRKHMNIGSTLFTMGLITLDQLKEVLHEQTGFDVVTTEQLSDQKKYIKLLEPEFIRDNKVIPISADGKNVILGVVKPLTQDIVKQIIYQTGLVPKQLLMTRFEFDNSYKTFFAKNEAQEAAKEAAQEAANSSETGADDPAAAIKNEVEQATGSVAVFVNKILTDGIDRRVSDIHIEPRLTGYIVRYRKDGMLQKVLDIPGTIESSVIARFKVMARMNIAENRRPQDGTFSINYKDCSYDFRINTLPVSGKEKVCIRILAPAVSLSSSDKEIKLVGASEADIDKVKQIVSCPNGIILTSGPTGSGKTTTLYSVLKSLNDETVNITTIEDPVEIKLEGINQSQINAKAGITFASCMRAILRQDPDIILVGEIRDYETLEIAISAALTGHLVLSTVHTNSAAATVTRMIEMGAKDYLVSSTLSGVIAQRLIRKLCDDCKEEYYPTREEAALVSTDPEEIDRLTKTKIYKAKGCNKCNFQGYKGRLGIYEIMQITKEIKKLIALGAHDLEIEEAAVANGMTTLHKSCIGHILNGQTTIEEFVRVLGMAGE